MAIALRHVAYVAGVELFGANAPVRSEYGRARAPRDVVLPFVGIGMPVRLTQRTGLDLHERAGHRRRNRKLVLRHKPVGAARINVRAARQQPVAMTEWAVVEPAGRRIAGLPRLFLCPFATILALGEICKRKALHT